MHTTHYSVVDADGNVVATTTTVNLAYGSGVLVAGAGFFFNNEMHDFATARGQPNFGGLIEGEQNRVEPGKRPLSSQSPTIVVDRAGNALMVIGAAGGPTIITGALQVILNVLDHRMSLGDTMQAPAYITRPGRTRSSMRRMASQPPSLTRSVQWATQCRPCRT